MRWFDLLTRVLLSIALACAVQAARIAIIKNHSETELFVSFVLCAFLLSLVCNPPTDEAEHEVK